MPAVPAPVERVTTLELFFDLVFVFTITQLTAGLVEELTLERLGHVVVMLGLIYWMYDGYAWLTNSVAARGARRQGLLLGGMAGYLVVAITIPGAYDGTGLTFGLALLAITTIHFVLFVRAAGADASAAMRRIGPRNVGAALVVVLGGALGGTVQEVLWALAFLGEWTIRAPGRIAIGPAHFVERHGLLVIVAIGESLVAVGVGASGEPVDAGLVAVVVLGLALNAALWWTYFGADADARVEAAFTAAGPRDRARIALYGFGYAHYVLLVGVVLTAVGVETAVAHPGDALPVAVACALGGGLALFQLGHAAFRRLAALPRTRWSLSAGAATLAAIPVGAATTASAGLLATVLLLGAVLAAEQRTATTSAPAPPRPPAAP